MSRTLSTWASGFAVAVAAGVACSSSPTGPGGGSGQTPPTLTCPASPPAVTSPNGQPMPVQYPNAVATGTAVNVTCSPSSGAAFPVGATTVVCTAVDSAGRTAACSFTITVDAAPRISLTRFAAFGDSITWGEDGTDFCGNTIAADTAIGRIRPRKQLPMAQQYPSVLQGLLQARYVGQTITVNALGNLGFPGERAGDPATWTRFTAQVIAPHVYDAVLLMEGANDVNAAAPADGIAGLRQMVETAKASGVRLFLATIPPEVTGRYYQLDPAAVRSFNIQVRSLAAFENVTLVDVEAAFGATPGTLISCDGLHPNADGYAVIANAFSTVLEQTLQTTGRPTTTSAGPAPALPRTRSLPRR